MINVTPLIRPLFNRRIEEMQRFVQYAPIVQREVLQYLVGSATFTEFGHKHNFSKIKSYDDFVRNVPLSTYEDLKPYIMQMLQGKKNVLWQGKTLNFAQSSGTSDGKSKYIPITPESLKRNHYQGASDALSLYLHLNPQSKIFSGKSFILGGSFSHCEYATPGISVGDLSATLINKINPLVNFIRVPSKEIALMHDWEKKLPALVEASKNQNITNISGVPSWFLTVLREVLKATGKNNIHQVWPNLEVFFHGGINFEPYKEQYLNLAPSSNMHFIETYNASEGFFATQSSFENNAMLLLLDIGVFYEFIPLCELGKENPQVKPIWEIEVGETYALVISSCNGLWRYQIGDTVIIEQLNPVKIKIAGRTKHYINAFGEEVMVHNTDQAIAHACAETSASVLNYTVAPSFSTDEKHGKHQWVIEFSKPPHNLNEFTTALDQHLMRINSDYEAKRYKSIFLDAPQVIIAQSGLFDKWLSLNGGKLGGQRKVPRLSNDRHIIDKLLSLND